MLPLGRLMEWRKAFSSLRTIFLTLSSIYTNTNPSFLIPDIIKDSTKEFKCNHTKGQKYKILLRSEAPIVSILRLHKLWSRFLNLAQAPYTRCTFRNCNKNDSSFLYTTSVKSGNFSCSKSMNCTVELLVQSLCKDIIGFCGWEKIYQKI